MVPFMSDTPNVGFNDAAYPAIAGPSLRIVELNPQETLFCQGDVADSVYYLQKGRVKLSVVSHNGKEATITLLSAGDFVGEDAVAAVAGPRTATSTAISTCTALKIGRSEMIRMLREEPGVTDVFVKFLLARGMRTQADLVDQLFNSSEKRLARTLLLMAEFGTTGERKGFISQITQETLAEMVGTTRSRVSFFMNRFRELGFIDYTRHNRCIEVSQSLLKVILLDQLPRQNSKASRMVGGWRRPGEARPARNWLPHVRALEHDRREPVPKSL